MDKAELVKWTGWASGIVEPLLPDDLQAGMVAFPEPSEGEKGKAIVLHLSPRNLSALMVALREKNRNGWIEHEADVTQDTLPLSGVKGWTSGWSGEAEHGNSPPFVLKYLRSAHAEIDLERDLLGLGTLLALPLNGQEDMADQEKIAKQIGEFVQSLEANVEGK